jgi:hypothetical protein
LKIHRVWLGFICSSQTPINFSNNHYSAEFELTAMYKYFANLMSALSQFFMGLSLILIPPADLGWMLGASSEGFIPFLPHFPRNLNNSGGAPRNFYLSRREESARASAAAAAITRSDFTHANSAAVSFRIPGARNGEGSRSGALLAGACRIMSYYIRV